jgi:protein ImuA
MVFSKKEIIAQLKKDILPLQGLKLCSSNSPDLKLGFMEKAFPNDTFPTGAVHEFLSEGAEYNAATAGFVSGLVSGLMQKGGVAIWISQARTIFPPALKNFNIEPDRVIFIDLPAHKHLLWTMEEALKCDGLAAVVGEISELNFTNSRRLQLAVEQSSVTGFLLRQQARHTNTIASVSRWKISPLPSELQDDLPGVGFPRWQVELLKIRNGMPGVWQIEWCGGTFRHIQPEKIITQEEIRKAG